MSHSHTPRTVERRCDVAVVGGSAAGLAAALQLGRQRRSVIVVDAELDDAPGLGVDRAEVRRHGVEVLAGRVEAVTGTASDSFRLTLTGGHGVRARRVVVADGASGVEGLDDLTTTDGGGPTEVEGLYTVGDDRHRGAEVGGSIEADLAEEDLAEARRSSGNAEDWQHRYRGEQMWSGNPNGSLVAEAQALTPGRALDVGAGEGGDAIWLAEQGWAVTANDIAQGALDRIAGAAGERGLDVTLLCADANARDAFEREAYDLVSAQYASIPRTADDRAIANLLGAVAPGGTLVVVSHDIEPMRAPIDTRTQSRGFDADAYVRVEDVAAALQAGPHWEIEVHEKRRRPPGSATAAHHVDDIVLRARRRA